jgi:hypothetical protein
VADHERRDEGGFARRPGLPQRFTTPANAAPHSSDMTRLCDQGYESNRSGVNAVSPGAMSTRFAARPSA